ncbi:MAG TPA: phosphoenolpyruvate--protein phosphotransferase [Sphingomicrobium sp.]|nr:phosphoenolpyruvate--protein phosphotransferase [Sphingomicrobium sp.]
MASLTVLAPLDGWCMPLAQVPDPVFAEGMIGDGVAIDPVSAVVVAPCDGEITTVPAGGHAVSIRTAEGVDVLVHVGIDSVKLAGQGFQPLVRVGQSIRAGEDLIRFDLDIVARGAKSLVTPIVVTPVDGLRIARRHEVGPIRAGDVLLELEYAANARAQIARDPVDDGAARRTVTVPLRHGLHARPAALLAKRARAVNTVVTLAAHGKTADARSVTAIMALGVANGDTLAVSASGANAARAVDEVVAGLDDALKLERAAGDESAPGSSSPNDAARIAAASSPAPAARPCTRHAEAGRGSHISDPPIADGTLSGVVAASGFATGFATRLDRVVVAVAENGKGAAEESAELDRALGIVRARLTRIGGVGGTTRREIAEAHLAFLDDPMLNEAAHEHIAAGKSAGFAWRAAIGAAIAALDTLADKRLRERADDLLDIQSHVLLALHGEAQPMTRQLMNDSVIVADELLPSELLSLDRKHLKGICLSGGGPTSHVAILAAAMEVPMLVGLGSALRQVGQREALIVDAERGVLHIAPSAEKIADAQRHAEAWHARRAAERAAAQRECRTRDGTRIEVFANLGSVAEAEAAVAAGAEGCGLLRTEFLFIDRDSAPSEAEQREVYQGIAAALAGRPLVLRLMDVGGDKPLNYLPLPHEENPALGLRGVRTALRYPDLLRTQLRAALRVKPTGVVRLLLPMITEVAEVRAIRSVVDELRGELSHSAPVEIGAMIETPAAALTADRLAAVVDFFSIGSNDLTQYSLAMDRGHPELARRIDALHPAVLKLIALATAAGERNGKLVAVCGGMAAEPAAVPLLVGLGVRELSVVPAAVPALKREVRELTVSDCAALAARCLEVESAAEVRALVAQTIASPGGA